MKMQVAFLMLMTAHLSLTISAMTIHFSIRPGGIGPIRQCPTCFPITTSLPPIQQSPYWLEVFGGYKNAITVVATNIIDFLAQAPVPTSTINAQQVVEKLNIQAQSFSINLGTASNASDALRQQLDKEVEDLVARASSMEKQIAENVKQLAVINAQVQEINDQVRAAQHQVNEAQKSEQNAENNVRREEDAVKNAEHCLGPIGGWFGSTICHLVNHDGIHRAEDDRNRARNELNASQQRLTQYRNQLGQIQQRQNQVQETGWNLDINKRSLAIDLAALNNRRNDVDSVDIKLKALIAHLGTLLGKSQVLVDVVKSLIDMETVIKPLTAIADQVLGYTDNAGDVNYLKAMKQKIIDDLPLIEQKLPKYALIPPAK